MAKGFKELAYKALQQVAEDGREPCSDSSGVFGAKHDDDCPVHQALNAYAEEEDHPFGMNMLDGLCVNCGRGPNGHPGYPPRGEGEK